MTFVPDSYETDGNGYATISVTLRNIPLGQYTIWEKPVLRYYLKDAWADTENVRITKKAEATYGKDPKETAVGTAALTVEKPDAALTFLNEKARYDKFSHKKHNPVVIFLIKQTGRQKADSVLSGLFWDFRYISEKNFLQ